MGARFSIIVSRLPQGLQEDQVQERVETELADLANRLSIQHPDSVSTRFNQHKGSDWFPVSAEVVGLVAEARHVSRMTESALDVTHGPVIDLWKLDPAGPRETAPPNPDVLAFVGAQTGMDQLQYRVENPALRKLTPHLELDLSALARGQGVDRLAALLESLRITDYLIEIGRAVHARGSSPADKPWIVAIRSPGRDERRIQAVTTLVDQSLATVVEQGVLHEFAGRRLGHLIDPRTDRPVDHSLASCTVVANSCLRADALASALMVLGPERGLQLARDEGWAVLLVVRRGSELVQKTTPKFNELLQISEDTQTTATVTHPSSFDAVLGASVMIIVAVAGAVLGVVLNRRSESGLQPADTEATLDTDCLPDTDLPDSADMDNERAQD